jgi:hypothetical protein
MTEEWDHDDPMSEISMLSTKQYLSIIILNSVFVTWKVGCWTPNKAVPPNIKFKKNMFPHVWFGQGRKIRAVTR